jgi:GT2 family glycosyltransferase
VKVSVVIPTRDRPRSLERCLAALGKGCEVIVVDDGSADPRAAAALAERHGARALRLEGRGPAAARNAGAAAAGGEVVCFTDDDCEPAAGWAEALAAPVLSGEAAVSAGRTVVGPEASAADRAWQAIADALVDASREPGSPSPGFAPTCNVACAAALLAELPFDESFPRAAGEDRDWSERAAARGAAPLPVPAALVVHRPGLRATSFLRQQFEYGRGGARYRAAGGGRGFGPAGFYAGLLRRGFAAGPASGVLVLAAQLATAAGVAAERTSPNSALSSSSRTEGSKSTGP